MNQPIRTGAANAFRVGNPVQVGIDRVEFVAAPMGKMWRVGNEPEPICPGHYRADPAFPVFVEYGQVRVDPAHAWGGRRIRGDRPAHRCRKQGQLHIARFRFSHLSGPIGMKVAVSRIQPGETFETGGRLRVGAAGPGALGQQG